MLQERDVRLRTPTRGRFSHFLSTFFVNKLTDEYRGYNFELVWRWTKNFDFMAMGKIFVPIKINNTHWCMAIIFVQLKRIQYYDSLGGGGRSHLETLLRYVADVHQRTRGSSLAVSEWELWCTTATTPRQENFSDCGVFALAVADFTSENLPLNFSQVNVTAFRTRIGDAILRGVLD